VIFDISVLLFCVSDLIWSFCNFRLFGQAKPFLSPLFLFILALLCFDVQFDECMLVLTACVHC